MQQDENNPCRSLRKGSVRVQQRLTVNIYLSLLICSSSAVLHKSTNIVKFYCSSQPTMCTCSRLDQYFIEVPCPRNSAQLDHQKLPFSRAAPNHSLRTMVPPAGLMAFYNAEKHNGIQGINFKSFTDLILNFDFLNKTTAS